MKWALEEATYTMLNDKGVEVIRLTWDRCSESWELYFSIGADGVSTYLGDIKRKQNTDIEGLKNEAVQVVIDFVSNFAKSLKEQL